MEANQVIIIWSILGTLGAALVMLLLWAIQRQVTSTSANTTSNAVLAVHIELLSREVKELRASFYKLERIEKDVDSAHEKIRKLVVAN